jgi:D-alanyl-D-alanine carboxypeptidase/D-alanyl-D-alanine-endopeptidase (penicillin-binding protein 4)
MPNSVAIGRARLKSGSLRDVASLAGYLDGLSGQRYVFVVLVNHPNANAARPAFDKLLEWAVEDQKKS